ncbi:M10 family metallopeptidase C-terminal domain-containing protein [Sedimentitalea sp. JM2-8]|uniref:M10 family metallopeptidase C-terminal domain-containing protein n=1 Tax=Sedimentitalea xiamensis TaxID=3050037 RepID=A0ABT7FCW4_9RHOB|nr:M10 family metallopeptidase C-terminal domain-containing protein [Sedimentitalea xiamensis]MDK3072858.1 M10 family metallopeptidase C-terminal domain-containing protein [Sedimentitalea xiamensis]
MSGLGKSTTFVAATGDSRIDGILYSQAWSGGTLTYSAPTSSADYGTGYGQGEHLGLLQPTALLIAAQQRYLDTQFGTAADDGFALDGFADVSLVRTTSFNATIRVAMTDRDPYSYGTAWAYYPATVASAGDAWLIKGSYDYSAPQVGNYANLTLLHEIGHALGLKHGHESDTYGALPPQFDAMEYTVMTYRSYVGAAATRYTNGTWDYAQSFMMQDIAALQHIYGANFTTNSGDTVYSWSPLSSDTVVDGVVALDPGGSRIFATIWDGGGTDTFDLSAYDTDLSIDLAPGAASVLGADQLAYLGDGNRASGSIYTALLYHGDTRSLIENALGGGGNDRLSGNAARNLLKGGDGEDRLSGDTGKDRLHGQRDDDILLGGPGQDRLFGGNGDDLLRGNAGDDSLRGGGGRDILAGGFGADIINGGAGNDRIIGGRDADRLTGGDGSDTFVFSDVTDSPVAPDRDRITDFQIGLDRIDLSRLHPASFSFAEGAAFSGAGPSVTVAANGADTSVLVDTDADLVANLRIELTGALALTASDFIL